MNFSRRVYEFLSEKIIDGFVLMQIDSHAEAGGNVDCSFIDANRLFVKIAGAEKKEDFIGKRFSDFGTAFNTSFLNRIQEFALLKKSVGSIKFEFYSKKLKNWYEVNAFRYNDSHIFILFRDITEIKKLSKLIKKSRHMKETHQQLITVLDSIEAIVYVSDMDTYEILFLNRFGRKIHGNLKGTKCYEKLQSGKKEPCSFCTNHKLLKKDKTPAALYKWEHKIESSGRWFECRDRAIRWIDGRLVRLEIATEITDRKKSEEELSYQLNFEKMVSEISSGFLSGNRNLNESVSRSLEITGKFFGFDRGYLFQYSIDGNHMANTHEWCAPGIKSHMERTQYLPVEKLPWWDKEISGKEYIYIEDVEALPEEASAEKEEFLIQEIKSILAFPFRQEGKVTGFMGFDSVKEKKEWTKEKSYLLKVVSEIIFNALSRHNIEEKLRKNSIENRELSNMLESLFDSIPDIIGVQDTDHRVIKYNRAGYQFLNKKPEEVLGKRCYNLIGRESACELCASAEVLKTKKPAKIEKYIAENDTWLDCRSYPVFNDHGEIEQIIEHIRDITKRKKYEEQLKYLGMHDNLTGIYNRAYFETELNRLEDSGEYPVTIISTDMDGLKLINDTISHAKGDEILVNCSSVISSALRKADILARVGGDEFVAILPKTDNKTAEKIVGRIKEKVKNYNKENPMIPLSISLGLSTTQGQEKSMAQTFKEADDTMYKDKLHKASSNRSQIIDALMVALGERDFVTQGHVERLTNICGKMGEEVGLSAKQINDIMLLARVHDLGKVGIPDNILFKEGPLTEKEWDIMRLHSEKGYRISVSSPDLSSVADLTLKHHESWDGSGYPLGLKKDEIPVECRILAIADAYDAMTNERPYRRTMSKEEAIEEIKRCSGKQFDPEMVKIFLKLIG